MWRKENGSMKGLQEKGKIERIERRKARRKEGNKPWLFLSWVSSLFFAAWGRRQCQWPQPSSWVSAAVNPHHSGHDPEHKICKKMGQFGKIWDIFHFLAVSQREIIKPLSPVSFQEGGWKKSPRANTEGFFKRNNLVSVITEYLHFFRKSNTEPKKKIVFLLHALVLISWYFCFLFVVYGLACF